MLAVAIDLDAGGIAIAIGKSLIPGLNRASIPRLTGSLMQRAHLAASE